MNMIASCLRLRCATCAYRKFNWRFYSLSLRFYYGRPGRPLYFHFVSFFFLLLMVALCNRADHYIFMLWFVLLSLFLLFSPRL